MKERLGDVFPGRQDVEWNVTRYSTRVLDIRVLRIRGAGPQY